MSLLPSEASFAPVLADSCSMQDCAPHLDEDAASTASAGSGSLVTVSSSASRLGCVYRYRPKAPACAPGSLRDRAPRPIRRLMQPGPGCDYHDLSAFETACPEIASACSLDDQNLLSSPLPAAEEACAAKGTAEAFEMYGLDHVLEEKETPTSQSTTGSTVSEVPSDESGFTIVTSPCGSSANSTCCIPEAQLGDMVVDGCISQDAPFDSCLDLDVHPQAGCADGTDVVDPLDSSSSSRDVSSTGDVLSSPAADVRRSQGVILGEDIETSSSPDRGTVLRASCDIEAGQTILVERPLLYATKRQAAEYEQLGKESGIDSMVLAFWANARAEDSVQEVLDLLAGLPANDPWATELHAHVERHAKRLHEALGGDSIEEFVQFAGIVKRHRGWCIDVQANGDSSSHCGQGVWRMACLLSHSCEPNCFWFSGCDGVREVRTLVPVRKGDELSVSYIEGLNLTFPTPSRREQLLRSHSFECNCARCSRSWDDVRPFPCVVWAQCGGTCYGASDGSASFLPCDVCGAEAPEEAVHRLLEEETQLGLRLAKADAMLNQGKSLPKSLREEILASRPLHDRHHLTRMLAKLRYTLMANPQSPCYRPSEAVVWVVWELRCLERLHPRPASSAIPFDMENAAGLILALGNAGHKVDLREVLGLYQSALRYLAVAYGITHPYARCCERKFRSALAFVQEGAESQKNMSI